MLMTVGRLIRIGGVVTEGATTCACAIFNPLCMYPSLLRSSPSSVPCPPSTVTAASKPLLPTVSRSCEKFTYSEGSPRLEVGSDAVKTSLTSDTLVGGPPLNGGREFNAFRNSIMVSHLLIGSPSRPGVTGKLHISHSTRWKVMYLLHSKYRMLRIGRHKNHNRHVTIACPGSACSLRISFY